MNTGIRRYFLPLRVLVVVAVFGLWQLLSAVNVLNPIVISKPTDIAGEIVGWFADGSIWSAAGQTLLTFAEGYLAGVIVGVVVGIAMGGSTGIRQYLDPFILFFNAIPKLVLVPLLIAIYGFTNVPGVIITFLVVIFLVAITVEKGMEEIEGDFIANTRMLGARRRDILRDVYLPAVGIWVVTSARLAIGLAFQSAVVAEFFGAGHGLGFLIVHGEQSFDVKEIWGGIVLTVVLALIIDWILAIIDRRVSRWLPAQGS
jgi:NitT/TauT family transport system permease protein